MEHDALSKSLFALPQVEADVLRIVAAGWVRLLDLGTLERLSAEHPSADLTLRAGDLAWRVRFRAGRLADGARPWLLLPTELQSTHNWNMGERQFEYAGRHFGALRREGALSREGEEPRVLPVVVYSGSGRWPRRPALAEAPPGFLQPGGYVLLDAAAGPLEDWPQPNRVSSWARLLRSDNPGGLRSALRAGLEAFSGRGDAAYRNSLRAWALALVRARMPGGGDVPLPEIDDGQGESEMTTLLEANFEKWEARVMERGRSEGIAQGVERERERLRGLARRLDPETAAKVAELLDRGD